MTAPHDNRCIGCLLGLALGDALGSHFEGQSPDWIARRYETADALLENPPPSPWYYTDDTQMTLGLAETLIEHGRVEHAALCQRFAAHYDPQRGYGRGARVVLEAMQAGEDFDRVARELFPGGSYGNGAAMRVAPVGLVFAHDHDLLWEQARRSALPTHVHPLGIEGAQLLALAVAICLEERNPRDHRLWDALAARCTTAEFQTRIEEARQASNREELIALGNGIAAHDSVVTAIACYLLWGESVEETIAEAILLGGDTDTIAAMAGALAGAACGASSISPILLNSLEAGPHGRDYLMQLGRQLASAAGE